MVAIVIQLMQIIVKLSILQYMDSTWTVFKIKGQEINCWIRIRKMFLYINRPTTAEKM